MCPSDDSLFWKRTVGDNKEIAAKWNKFPAFIFITENKGEIPALERLFFLVGNKDEEQLKNAINH